MRWHAHCMRDACMMGCCVCRRGRAPIESASSFRWWLVNCYEHSGTPALRHKTVALGHKTLALLSHYCGARVRHSGTRAQEHEVCVQYTRALVVADRAEVDARYIRGDNRLDTRMSAAVCHCPGCATTYQNHDCSWLQPFKSDRVVVFRQEFQPVLAG